MTKIWSKPLFVSLLILPLIVIAAMAVMLRGRTNFQSTSSRICRNVGQPASLKTNRFPVNTSSKVQGKALILGCDQISGIGDIEVVGYRSTIGFCHAVDYPSQGITNNAACWPRKATWRTFCGGAVCAYPLTWTLINGKPFYQLAGELTPNVRRVEITQRGATFRRDALVVRPNAELMRELRSPKNFGMFIAVGRGCPPPHGFTLAGIGDSGDPINTSHAKNYFAKACN